LSSVVRSDLLGRLTVEGEYVIDPQKTGRGHAGRARRSMSASPENRAKSIVDQANEEAAALISAAQQEAEAIRSAAHREGREAALAEMDAEKNALDERIARIEADAERQVQEFWVSIEPELLKLAVDIARKIVHRETSESQEFVLETVKAGLHQLRDRQELRIRVNPADYEFVREHKEEIASSCDGVRSLEVLDDRRVDQGGSVIESGKGHLDVRIETQLREAERSLLEAAHDGDSEVVTESE